MSVHITGIADLTITGVKNSVVSLTGSVSYLKAFIPIAAYNIINNRIKYEPWLFETHTLKKTEYKTVSKKVPKRHDLFNVYHWLKNAMEGVNKKYLKQLYLIIRDRDTKVVIEFYRFTVQYAEQDKANMVPRAWENVLESTARIFQSIKLLSELEMLDDRNISFAMQVVLNESAPESYITPNFDRGIPYVEPEENHIVSIGSLFTAYHKLKVHAMFNVDEEEKNEEISSGNKNSVLIKPSAEDSTSKKATVLQDTRFKECNEHNDGVQAIEGLQQNIVIDEGNLNKRNKRARLNIKNGGKDSLPVSKKRTRQARSKANQFTQRIDVEDDEAKSEDYFQPSERKKVTNKSDHLRKKKKSVQGNVCN